MSFQIKIIKWIFFFSFLWRVGEDHPRTGSGYCRRTESLNSHLLSWSAQTHLTLLPFSRLYLYHKVRWHIQRRGRRAFTFTSNLMLEKWFSIRTSRVLNTRGKKTKNVTAGGDFSNRRGGECTLTPSTHTEWKGHSHSCCKQILPTTLQIPVLDLEEPTAPWEWISWGRQVRRKVYGAWASSKWPADDINPSTWSQQKPWDS